MTQESGASGTHAGDYMICAIPFPCLQPIEVAPAFSPDKQKAIAELRYDPVVRVFAQTRRRFWEKDGLNGFADGDEGLEIWNPTFDQPGPRGILLAYTEDGLARRVYAKSESERVSFGVDAIEKTHPRLRDEVEHAFQFSWADDPWARGAYTYFEPGQLLSLSPIIRQPEGRIFFAGEHASNFPGWMQGALESGLRAARQVHEADLAERQRKQRDWRVRAEALTARDAHPAAARHKWR